MMRFIKIMKQNTTHVLFSIVIGLHFVWFINKHLLLVCFLAFWGDFMGIVSEKKEFGLLSRLKGGFVSRIFVWL